MANIKAQVRSVGELLTAVAPSLGVTFVEWEKTIANACEKQVALEGKTTSKGGSFGSFTVAKVLATLTVFTKEETTLIAAAWSLIHAGQKITGFKF